MENKMTYVSTPPPSSSKPIHMKIICNYAACTKEAFYGLTFGSKVRCKTHKENMKPHYAICVCGKKQPTYNEPGETKPIYCSECKTPTMINVRDKRCKCGDSIAFFNEPGEKTPICCSLCKTNTMINIKSKRCKCGKKQPTYNEPGKTIPICCSECKSNTMINVADKKCKCGKAIPNFNEPGEKPPICCALCRTETMVNVRTKKCLCDKHQPAFNMPGIITPICCSECKKEGMINVTEKRNCKCEKSKPTFHEPGETIAICCSKCKTKTMISLKHKKCRCGKVEPTFNEPGEKVPICCASCKTDTMIDVKSKRCKCGKARPTYNYFGKKTAICCRSCKSELMVDIKHKKCIGIGNQDCPYYTRASEKYRGYCMECFRREFPLDPLTFQIRYKSKEIIVRDFINSEFEGFQHDKPLETSHCDCTVRRRIDHRKLINNTLLVIETDENQHKSYDKMDEDTRYDDLFMAFSGKWIYIRFNPDKYRAKDGTIANPAMDTRLYILENEIDKQMERIEYEENTELVERIYLFYDGYT